MAYNNYGGYDQGGGGYNNNYSTTSYGAQGGADGGGFMAGGSQGGEKKNSRDKETLRPLTIRQVHQAEEIHTGSEVMLDGEELTRITVVAQIRSVTKLTTNTTFKLDDGTATAEGKLWHDTEAPMYDDSGAAIAQDPETPQQNDWIRILGQIKFVQNKRFITIQNMKKIKDMNEINYHLLEATYIWLYITKGPQDQSSANSNAMQGVQNGYGTDAGANGGVGGNLAGTSATARRVFQVIKADSGNEGVHLDQIARELNIPYAQVKQAADELNERSAIFSTVDEETYSVLDS